MPRWACMSSSLPATVLVVLLSTFSRSPVAHAVGVPVYEPQKWNQAYKLSVTNITAKQQIGLDMLLSAGWGKNCHEEGYNTPATAAPLNSCYRKSNLNGTWTYWLKLPGDWRTNSNSYCYALDVYKGGFCKPGKGNKLRDPLFAQWITCDKLKQAVMADGARPVTKQQVLKGQPPSGHYIALKARNDSCTPYYCWLNDYTVLRKDNNSFWSWKEPRGPARDTDLFGRKVTNPENVILPGHYDIFCGYYHVVPQNMTIGVQIEDNPYLQNNLSEYVKFYRKSYPGIVVNLDVLPYNNATDDAFDLFSQTLIDQDLTWESKRNTSEWLDWQAKQQHQQQLQQPQPEPQLTDADFQPASEATATGVPHPTGSSSVSSGWSIGGAGWGPPDPNAASSTSN